MMNPIHLPVLSETGSSMALCFTRCGHDECHMRHIVAFTFCRLCHCAIGYYARYHKDQPKGAGFVHSRCLAEVLTEVMPGIRTEVRVPTMYRVPEDLPRAA